MTDINITVCNLCYLVDSKGSLDEHRPEVIGSRRKDYWTFYRTGKTLRLKL